MQLLTPDQVVQIYQQARGMAHEFFGFILASVWNNILGFFPSMFTDIAAHNWSAVIADALIIVGLSYFFYRLVLKNPLQAIFSFHRYDL
jgi:hypothetical protein